MSNEIAYYKNLVEIMLKTRGTRFTAAQLLEDRERFSVVTLALLSVFLIGVSVVFLALPDVLGTFGAKYFGALSVVSSISILVITLIDNASGRRILAHRLHQNALRITKLIRAMERELEKASPDLDSLRLHAESYEDNIAETEVNHSTSDYTIYQFSRQKSTCWFTAIIYSIRNHCYSSFIFCSAVWPNLLVLMTVFVATSWYFISGHSDLIGICHKQ